VSSGWQDKNSSALLVVVGKGEKSKGCIIKQPFFLLLIMPLLSRKEGPRRLNLHAVENSFQSAVSATDMSEQLLTIRVRTRQKITRQMSHLPNLHAQ
jgi:hypothetical protein